MHTVLYSDHTQVLECYATALCRSLIVSNAPTTGYSVYLNSGDLVFMKGGGVVQDCFHIDTGLLEGRGKWNRQKSLLAIVGKEQVTAATRLKVFDCSWHCLLVLPLPSTQLVRWTDGIWTSLGEVFHHVTFCNVCNVILL